MSHRPRPKPGAWSQEYLVQAERRPNARQAGERRAMRKDAPPRVKKVDPTNQAR